MGNKAERTVETVLTRGRQERCVLCGRLINVERDCPISMRKYYIAGAGQLCRSCYYDVYES